MGLNFRFESQVRIISDGKSIALFLLGFIFVVTLTACAGLQTKETDEATIPSSDMLEVCVQLSPDQVLDYFFRSSLPLTFRILYHENGNSVYAYSLDEASYDAGLFYPDRQQFYCMKWINSSAIPAKIVYDYRLLSSK